MRKITLSICVAALFCSCTQNTVKTQDGMYEKLFSSCMDKKDYTTAIVAAQMILMSDSSKTNYADSLPELYAATNNIEACAASIDGVLKRHPNDEKFLQIKALVLQEQADGQGLLDIYNKLYTQTKKLSYLYQVGTIHFSTGNMQEAEKTVDIILPLAKNSSDSLDIFIGEQQKQKVPIYAASLNFKGYIQAQKRDLNSAKNFFEDAIKAFPDFVMAKRNLQQLMGGPRR
jgi:tetratricopeptide (TPR) repeat protein